MPVDESRSSIGPPRGPRSMEDLNLDRAKRTPTKKPSYGYGSEKSPRERPSQEWEMRKRNSRANSLAIRRRGPRSRGTREENALPRRPGAQSRPHSRSPQPSTAAGVKRSYSQLEPNEQKLQRSHPSSLLTLSPALPPNSLTDYLESLLESHKLTLILKPLGGIDRDPITHIRPISKAGLILNEIVRDRNADIPLLNLPSAIQSNGEIKRSVTGRFLEDIWFELTPEAKLGYARQIRNIVCKMRTSDGKKHLLGSVSSGSYSLMLDHHARNTYWAVRPKPSESQFVAFLASSFSASVPVQVAGALASQFRPSYPLCLSHCELCPRNFIVENSKILHIVGWDSAGWYPDWWEYCRFFEARTRQENQDWYEYAAEIFPDESYLRELAAYQGIARCQRP